jgi:hypothetical protein
MNPDRDLAELASLLLVIEAARHAGPLPVLHVAEKLRQGLTRIAGSAGFRTLFVRSLKMAQAKVPALSALSVWPDGSLRLLIPIENPQLAWGAHGALIAEFLELLAQFIGKPVLLTIVFDIWPELDVRQPVLPEQYDAARQS